MTCELTGQGDDEEEDVKKALQFLAIRQHLAKSKTNVGHFGDRKYVK